MNAQLGLFDAPPGGAPALAPEKKPARVGWSHSRREMLEQCPRRYYYQYYGSHARVAKTEPQKSILRFLKRLSNRYLRLGEIVHLVIQTYLKRLRQGESWSLERLLSWARDMYRRDLTYSQHYRPGEPLSDEKYPPILLLEFYTGIDNAEELWAESETRLIAALTNFVESPKFARFHTGSCQANALIEKRITVKTSHFSLKGQIDLAYSDQNRVVIVDWKIGSSSGGGDSLQLLSYALAAMQEFRCQPEQIDLCRAHLVDNEVIPFVAGEKEIVRARARILQDMERMRALDGYGCDAVSQVFTPCAQPRIYALCPFQKICPKE